MATATASTVTWKGEPLDIVVLANAHLTIEIAHDPGRRQFLRLHAAFLAYPYPNTLDPVTSPSSLSLVGRTHTAAERCFSTVKIGHLEPHEDLWPGARERIHGIRLRFVYRQPGPSLLVADNVRLTARGRAAACAKRTLCVNIGRRQGATYSRLSGRTTVPLFILVPQVSVKKRLDVDGASQKWIGALPQLVLRNWQNHA